MQYGDDSFYPSDGFSLSGGDTSDIGASIDSSFYSLPPAPDASQYYGPAATGSPTADVLSAGGTVNAQGVPQGSSLMERLMGGLGGSGAPGAGGGGLVASGGNQFGLPGLLGLLGGGAGLLGTLLGGGVTGGTRPQQGVPARAAGNQAYAGLQALQPFAQGQTPLQQQQAGMLGQLAGGQVPPGFAQLVARAYDPAYQDVYRRATDAGRQAGFYDQPAFSPPGGAIMGPAGAALQGQQAQSLLGLLTQLPSLYNQPIAQQYQAAQGGAQGFGNLMGQYPYAQQQTQPLAPQVLGQFGNMAQGAGQALQQGQMQQGNQQTQQLLNQYLLQQMGQGQQQGGISLSQYPT